MKKLLQIILLIPLLGLSQGVIITEIADPNESSVLRYIEIYNSGNSQSLTNYYLLRWTNGNSAPTSKVSLATACGSTLERFQYCIISNKATSTFANTFGFYSDYNDGSDGPADSNGDDNIAIVSSSGGITYSDSSTWTVIDAFGNAGTDGSSQWHEFEDGRAERKSSVQNPVSTWNQSSNWNVDNDSGGGAGARGYNQDFDPGSWIGSNDVDTWKGGTSGDWSVGSNWGSGNVPTADERVWIRQLHSSGSNNALEIG